jgi:hypothetical protein
MNAQAKEFSSGDFESRISASTLPTTKPIAPATTVRLRVMPRPRRMASEKK